MKKALHTYGLTVDVSNDNADVLIPILSDQLKIDIIQRISEEAGTIAELPTIHVEDVSTYDEETGKTYTFKKISARCHYYKGGRGE